MITTIGLGRRSIVFTFVAVFLFVLLLTYNRGAVPQFHRTPSAFQDGDDPISLLEPANEAEQSALCRKHNFKPFTSGTETTRKIYDLFLFSHELDWLEIRLNTLAPYVDYFVIIESPSTFTGMNKPLFLQDNWDKFAPFHSKIIHKIVKDPGPAIGMTTWVHEGYFRNSLFHSVFPTLLDSPKAAEQGDVLVVSDVDEIPKPATLNVLKFCEFPDRLTLRSNFYYYSFQWKHIGEQWPHPQATTYHGLSSTLTPNELRNGISDDTSKIPFWSAIQRWWQKADMWDAAWHCSSCFKTIEETRAKMESFSHTPLNTEENRDERTMVTRVREGQDLFGRPEEQYRRVENNKDVPKYVLEHSAKFKYMLNRDGEDAGFSDWTRPAG